MLQNSQIHRCLRHENIHRILDTPHVLAPCRLVSEDFGKHTFSLNVSKMLIAHIQ